LGANFCLAFSWLDFPALPFLSSHSIAEDILKEGAMTPYEISFRLRLNQKRTKEYLEFLQKNSLVDCEEKEDGKRVCEIAENGKVFFENLRSVLDPNGSIRDPKENSGA
jgi:predicted transcriptional regulator